MGSIRADALLIHHFRSTPAEQPEIASAHEAATQRARHRPYRRTSRLRVVTVAFCNWIS